MPFLWPCHADWAEPLSLAMMVFCRQEVSSFLVRSLPTHDSTTNIDCDLKHIGRVHVMPSKSEIR